MAITPTIQASQAGVTTVTSGETPNVLVAQAFVAAVANFPTERIDASQFLVSTITSGATATLEVAQSFVMAVVRGRVEDPKVRAWTFTLDGHDYYVLRLGNTETLVYDAFAEQWYVWGSNDSDLWRAYTGINWIGGDPLANEYGTNVVVGDDGNGTLYFLNPLKHYDDDAVEGAALLRTYLRRITGQVSIKSRDSIPCYGFMLMGSVGEMDEAGLTAITLSSSDDQGNTYTAYETINIPNADYNARVDWRSLGSFAAPGRLFRVEDYGTLQRIDYMEMLESE